MGFEQNTEQLNNQKTPQELLEKANSYLLSSTPEDIQEQLDSVESKTEFVRKFKESILEEGELDRSNYFESILIQTLGRLNGTYNGEIDGSWGDNTQDSYLNTFTVDERNTINVTGEGLLKKTYIDGNKHKVLEREEEYITSEEKIASMITTKLDEAGISREAINEITNRANLFKEKFPELELYLGQGKLKLKEALSYLEENKDKIEGIEDKKLKEIFYGTIQALQYAEIKENPEKMEFLREKQKVEIALDCFEILNSDENFFYSIENENQIYYEFKEGLTQILTEKDLTKDELNIKIKDFFNDFVDTKISEFVEQNNTDKKEIDSFIYQKYGLETESNTYSKYDNKELFNKQNTERIKEKFYKFREILNSIGDNRDTRENIYSKAINGFVDTTSDNPFTNKDLGFARKEMTQMLKSKMINTFLKEYEEEFSKLIKAKFPKEKLDEFKKDVEEELKENEDYNNLNEQEKISKLNKLLIIKLNEELEPDIIKSLEKNEDITGTKKENLERYIDLFDPKNEFTELGIDGKNVIAEELVSLPLTAFVIGRLSKAAFGIQTGIKELGVDFVEGAGFELLTKARQSRLEFDNYSAYDFMVGSIIGGTLFYSMKVQTVFGRNIKFDGNAPGVEGIMNRGKNHLSETSMFTAIEGIGTGVFYQENIFEDGVSEKLVANMGILYLVKLGYKPSDLGGILPEYMSENIDLRSSATRTKSNAKMKGVGAGKADSIGNLKIQDVLTGNIEDIMVGFKGVNSKIDIQFKELLTRGGEKTETELDAIKLIKHEVDLKVGELELNGIRIQTQEQRDFVRNYKLERIAEFKKLVESSENGEIPKEIEMNFGGRKWKLELNDVREMNEYFKDFTDVNKEKSIINDID